MGSRWGPKRSRSSSPMPPSASPNFPFADEPDFELVDTVEWGPDDASQLDELAPKPKPDKNDDPCACIRSSSDPTVMTCIDLSCVLFACQEECRGSCESGDQCGNKRIQRRQWKQLEVFSAGKKGKGLKVLEDVKKGDFVAEYVGRAVNRRYLPHLFRRYANERKLYIMALTNETYLDARHKGGIARYINHSCDPNCVVERWKVRGILRAAVIARKDISAGGELSFDYQWERKRGRAPTKCHCGAAKCRGTLEVPRSMEEEALERKLSTHWQKPLIQRAGKEIVNRCIQLFSKETQEYFPADVTSYDESTGKHLLMYRHDLEEVWEDLKKEDWMILDEEAEQFIIRKKTASTAALGGSLLTGVDISPSMTPNLLLQGQRTQNYIYVQTPIKDAMYSKHLIERCQRSCRVNISSQQFAKPPLPPDQNSPEETEKYRSLEQSVDGTVWKLTIVGSDIGKAHSILEKNVAYLGKTLLGATEMISLDGGSVSVQATSGDPQSEVVLPRSIVESVKRRLPMLREKCRSVNITFVPSESKSKQFAKLIVDGTLQSDIESAKDHLWQQLNVACKENNSPKTPSGVYKDLGFLGGELSSSDFHRLLEYDRTTTTGTPNKNQDAKEDLTRWSPFFASFEATQRCTIWVQSDADKGRIDGSNRVVSEATPNSPRKIHFGCDPKTIPTLWNLVKQRAAEVARGVKYLYLGPDRLYQPSMMRKGGQFFEFVRHVTGASVTVDSMTGDHLRIDGRGSPSTPVVVDTELPDNVSEEERAALAEELILLQIELYRDHCIRRQNWIFGRDWTFARRSSSQSKSGTDDDHSSVASNRLAPATRTLSFDSKAITNACLEIAEIVSTLGLEGATAGHSTVIMYRFLTIMSQNNISSETQLKIREVALACIFIANKSQKVTKWRKLDAVLEAAYSIFYPGTENNFDPTKEEVLVWEEKVIAAESEILESLEYDVSWRGLNWILAAAVGTGGMDRKLAKEALSFSVSGPLLAAGSDLWLTYGAEYVFAAAAGFMEAELDKLFPALSLIPIKVHQAAELIATSVKNTGFGKRQSHPLFRDGKKGLLNRMPRIKDTCALGMAAFAVGYHFADLSETEQRYRIVGERNKKRRMFRGVPASIVSEFVLPALDGICAESMCTVFIEKDGEGSQQSIILEGSWRALSIASYLLEQSLNGKHVLGVSVEGTAGADSQSSIQAKGHPGLLQMKKIETVDGWSGTIQSQVSNQSFWGRKTGGKCCVPAKIKESTLRQGGLRWWIPSRYGPSPTGSICDMFLVNNDEAGTLEALASLTHAFQGESAAFSMLTSSLTKKSSSNGTTDRFVAVSLQRWPPEKVTKREQDKGKKTDAKGKKAKGYVMQVGYSPAALQEIQLLNQLHGLIKSPQGHPNFVLPVGVALPSDIENGELTLTPTATKSLDLKRIDEDIFSLTRSSLENEVAAEKEQKRKDMITGPHLVFQATPFILQRFVSRKKKSDADDHSISPTILGSWFHDLLSALLHCHANDVVLRNIQSDQMVVDHSGVLKIGGMYRGTVLSKEDRGTNILEAARSRKSKSDDDDILKDPYACPEMLLGSPKFTKETDVWTIGCLMAHLLLNKPIYSGKDRKSLLAAMYKMIGTPSSENFPHAVKFPHYEKPTKKYRPGVAKALQYMMKDEENVKHAGAIDLISKMLQLDPKKRLTAVQALQHEYMLNYVENCNSEEFRQQYVRDWMTLRKKLIKPSKTEDDEAKERERGIKRKAMMIAATSKAMDNEEDDLYDMDDILGEDESAKRPKT